jgi:microcystin-dependent protein
MVGEIRIMALTREAVIHRPGYSVGDMKMVTYSISFTANQLVTPETDWFLLNGAVISQTTYPILYAKYGTNFNTGGEGTGNFRLPDFTDGKVPVLKGLTNFTSYAGVGGEITHALSTPELAVHNHADTFTATESPAHSTTGSGSTTATNSSHTHSHTTLSTGANAGTGGGDQVDLPDSNTSGTSGAVTHTHTASASVNNNSTPWNLSVGGSISAAGSGTAHNNMQPYLVMGGWLVRFG